MLRYRHSLIAVHIAKSNLAQKPRHRMAWDVVASLTLVSHTLRTTYMEGLQACRSTEDEKECHNSIRT